MFDRKRKKVNINENILELQYRKKNFKNNDLSDYA